MAFEASTHSTFKAAIPYGIGTLAIGTVGAITAVAATAVAIKVIGVAMAIIGAYGFFATLACGIMHSGDPEGFRAEWPKYAGAMIGSAAADIISKIASSVIGNLVDRALGRHSERYQ